METTYREYKKEDVEVVKDEKELSIDKKIDIVFKTGKKEEVMLIASTMTCNIAIEYFERGLKAENFKDNIEELHKMRESMYLFELHRYHMEGIYAELSRLEVIKKDSMTQQVFDVLIGNQLRIMTELVLTYGAFAKLTADTIGTETARNEIESIDDEYMDRIKRLKDNMSLLSLHPYTDDLTKASNLIKKYNK